MATMKTADLSGAALAWAVDRCEGVPATDPQPAASTLEDPIDPLKAKAIMARENLRVVWSPLWNSWLCVSLRNAALSLSGRTVYEAAMRAYVDSRLGATADVPAEILGAACDGPVCR